MTNRKRYKQAFSVLQDMADISIEKIIKNKETDKNKRTCGSILALKNRKL